MNKANEIKWEGTEYPQISGPYTVSVLQDQFLFTAQAYFDSQDNKWFEVNPYDYKSPHTGNLVKGVIKGWVDGLAAYGGRA